MGLFPSFLLTSRSPRASSDLRVFTIPLLPFAHPPLVSTLFLLDRLRACVHFVLMRRFERISKRGPSRLSPVALFSLITLSSLTYSFPPLRACHLVQGVFKRGEGFIRFRFGTALMKCFFPFSTTPPSAPRRLADASEQIYERTRAACDMNSHFSVSIFSFSVFLLVEWMLKCYRELFAAASSCGAGALVDVKSHVVTDVSPQGSV